jgi:hypothetical protein
MKKAALNRYFAMNPSAAREDFTSLTSPGVSNPLFLRSYDPPTHFHFDRSIHYNFDYVP